MRDQKKVELAQLLVKANADFKHKRINQVALSHAVDEIQKTGRVYNICPNEIANDAMNNREVYAKQLESLHVGVKYQ